MALPEFDDRRELRLNRKTDIPVFWLDPSVLKDELHWYDPPLHGGEERPSHLQAEELLRELGEKVPDLPLHAWLLLWSYVTRARAATAERQRIEEEAQEQLERHNADIVQRKAAMDIQLATMRERLQEIRQEWHVEKLAFAEVAARTGLPCDTTSPDPRQVTAALEEMAPSLDEIAGRREVGPVTEEAKSWWESAGGMVFGMLAPLVSGFMLALCLGTLIGIISLTDLQRGDRLYLFAIAAVFGFVIVYVLGEFVYASVGALARYLDLPKLGTPVPRFRRALPVAALLFLGVLLLAGAEVTAEALGLRELHLQRLQELQRLDAGAEMTLLPLWAYAFIGVLITGPYLAYKAAKAWGNYERRLRESALLYEQYRWLEEKRDSAEMQEALHRASRVVQARQRLDEAAREVAQSTEQYHALKPQLGFDDKTIARLEAAHAAAAGETARLHALIADIITARESLTARRRWNEQGVLQDNE